MKKRTDILASWATVAAVILGGSALCGLVSRPLPELSDDDRILCEQLYYTGNLDRGEDIETMLVTPSPSLWDCKYYMLCHIKAYQLNNN